MRVRGIVSVALLLGCLVGGSGAVGPVPVAAAPPHARGYLDFSCTRPAGSYAHRVLVRCSLSGHGFAPSEFLTIRYRIMTDDPPDVTWSRQARTDSYGRFSRPVLNVYTHCMYDIKVSITGDRSDDANTRAQRYCGSSPAKVVAAPAAVAARHTARTLKVKLKVTIAAGGQGRVTGSGGLSCSSTCTKLYKTGTQVKLTATPTSSYAFSGWSGACSGKAACVVTMSARRRVTATFKSAASTAVLPGSYSGSATNNIGPQSVTLYVSSNGTQIQDVVANTYLTCSPSAPAFYSRVHIAAIPIQSNGSFTYTGTETGVYSNTSATFTYTFNGHFHGLSSSGQQRVSGQLREDVVYSHGANINCSSDVMPWSATH
jgi:Divergent InlB B-repeat domain